MPTRKEWKEDREQLLQTYSSWLADAKVLMADEVLARQLQDDRPIALRRKRRSSSSVYAQANNAAQGSITVDMTTNTSSSAIQSALPAARTPKKSKKRVRFSNPGPDSMFDDASSTGLTPAVARASLHSSTSTSIRSRKRTPRRHSTPAVPATEYIQFTPLKQELEPRVKRRLRRNGLSETMNHIEQDRRAEESARSEETNALKEQLEAKDQEIARLEEELQAVTDPKAEAGSRLAELEQERGQLREQIASSQVGEVQDEANMADYYDHDMTDDATINTSSHTLTASPSKKQRPYAMDAHTQASFDSLSQEATMSRMSMEYAVQIDEAKQEKRDLFHKLRPHFPPSQFASASRETSPAPEFLNRLADTLLTAKARADDAEHALTAMWTELKGLGFSGDSMEAIVNEMKQEFRQARIELERAVPGETAFGFEPAKVVPALIRHIQNLAIQLRDKEFELRGEHDRHAALSGQFDATLGRLDNAARRITELEETIDTGAEEMLNTRMTVRRLEKELDEKEVGISRLIAASDKYRGDIKDLEDLVKGLEYAKAQSDEALADLECKVTAEEQGRRTAEASSSQQAQRIQELEISSSQRNQELENSVEQVKSHAAEVEAQLEALKFEKEQLLASMQARMDLQAEKYESHLGILNVRLSNLTTALASANAEVDKLKVIKEKLEKRIREEVDEAHAAMQAMQERAIRSVARNNEVKKDYHRKSTIRYANGVVDNDEVLEMRGPLTPDSAVRFKDYVEVGRGKHRRKYDSGIGVLSEEEGDDEVSEGGALPGDSGVEAELPSSPAAR